MSSYNKNVLDEIEREIREKNSEELVSEQPFYKQPISKPKSKKLTNQELLQVLPFYDNVGILRKRKAFRNYVETYEVEVIDDTSLSDLLSMSKNSIKSLFNDLLIEKRGFKYILTTKITLKKRINNNETRYETVYFNSKVKTIINQRYHLNDSFVEILNTLDAWINEGSALTIGQIDGLYINVANYEPVSGSSYIPLPKELNNSKKGLINLKNKDHKCFMWCHIRLINPKDTHPERINKEDKKIAAKLNYSGIEFPLNIKDYELTEDRFEMNVNVFGYENKVYPLYVSKKSHTQVVNLLLITEEGKSHYVFIKDFNRLMYSKIKTKNQHKKYFCMHCLQNFTSEEVLSNHKKQCLLINGTQAVNYESGTRKFKNYEKQIPIPFKMLTQNAS